MSLEIPLEECNVIMFPKKAFRLFSTGKYNLITDKIRQWFGLDSIYFEWSTVDLDSSSRF